MLRLVRLNGQTIAKVHENLVQTVLPRSVCPLTCAIDIHAQHMSNRNSGNRACLCSLLSYVYHITITIQISHALDLAHGCPQIVQVAIIGRQ